MCKKVKTTSLLVRKAGEFSAFPERWLPATCRARGSPQCAPSSHPACRSGTTLAVSRVQQLQVTNELVNRHLSSVRAIGMNPGPGVALRVRCLRQCGGRLVGHRLSTTFPSRVAGSRLLCPAHERPRGTFIMPHGTAHPPTDPHAETSALAPRRPRAQGSSATSCSTSRAAARRHPAELAASQQRRVAPSSVGPPHAEIAADRLQRGRAAPLLLPARQPAQHGRRTPRQKGHGRRALLWRLLRAVARILV